MPDAILDLLNLYPATIRPASPPEPLGNAGGLSGATLWRFEGGGSKLVARAWPVDGPNLAAIQTIHGWLARVAPLGFIPAPIRSLDGRTAVEFEGRTWEVAPWLEGGPETGLPPDLRRVRAAFSALAAFHLRLAVPGLDRPSPGLAARRAEIEGLRVGGFEAMERAVAPSDDPLADLARRWLARARSLLPILASRLANAGHPLPLQPCLRDARPEHFLFDGSKLSGLVDFGAMDIETVAADLARLLSLWLGDDRPARAEALGAYEAIRPLSAPERGAIAMFEESATVLGPGHWVRWRFVEGKEFADADQVRERLEAGLDRLDSWATRSTSIRAHPPA